MSSDQCPRCGSAYFREEVLVEIPRFSAKDALELQVEYPISILVCLCGYRVPPLQLDSWYAKLPIPKGRLLYSLKRSEEYTKTLVPLASLQLAAERSALPELQARVRQLESAIEQMRAKQELAASREKARGREWLVHELQNKGLKYREARAALKALVEGMREGLRKDGVVETPIGTFELRPRNEHEYPPRRHIVFTEEPGWLDGTTPTTIPEGPDDTGRN
jgi:hypothetical protein